MAKRFNVAYIAQDTGHDFSELGTFCDRLVFLTTGDEAFEELTNKVYSGLADFDPHRDVVVPVGKVGTNLIVGQALGELLSGQLYQIALFRGSQGTYIVKTVDAIGQLLKEAA